MGTVFRFVGVAVLALAAVPNRPAYAQDKAQWRDSVKRAVAYLSVEVEKWRPENGCFSCHNNGDGARALYLARAAGFEVPGKALAETTEWLLHPGKWDANPGNPIISDKKLARLQFSAALAAMPRSDEPAGSAPLDQAVRGVLADQTEAGFWRVDTSSEVGSPVTWGNPLATLYTVKLLTPFDRYKPGGNSYLAAKKGLGWLNRMEPKTTIGKAVLMSALSEELAAILGDSAASSETRATRATRTCESLLRQQGSDGGWGPYPGAPSEVFDTAVVVMDLNSCILPVHSSLSAAGARARALQYLIRTQASPGGWPETTRPPGGQSYAQHISTTAWALMALLSEYMRSI